MGAFQPSPVRCARRNPVATRALQTAIPNINSLSVTDTNPSWMLLDPPTQAHLNLRWSMQKALKTEAVPMVPKIKLETSASSPTRTSAPAPRPHP